MPRPPEHPVDVFRFTKDARTTELSVRPTPLGPEIRCIVDGTLSWSRICRTSEELRAELTRLHADFIERGWTETTKAQA